jgi:redox-sensitive bicupin YhaK (pirin superfamily)
MIQIVRANERYFSDYGWLKTYWLFSFAEYYDPNNIQFGALRVFNDDVIEPNSGFPTHPHREMEIITIVLEGEITHRDSMGNKTVIRAGDVQRMSAGTGLTHSEFNLADTPVHLYQIWMFPDEKALKPTYDQKTFPSDAWNNRLLPVASGQGLSDVVTFNTDATIFRSHLEAGKSIDYLVPESRRVLIYVTAGDLQLNDQRLKTNDEARIDIENELLLTALSPTDLILVEVPSCKGWGYDSQTLKGERK